MINKRLLVKALLAHNDENSFYDKKLKIDLSTKEGKAKFLKHVCALSNSNPSNNSYMVIGVSDKKSTIIGVDFFDDSKLQNLVNAYLDSPPRVMYENIPFPHLPEGKVVGLVTIFPTASLTTLQKNIWKYLRGSIFVREGSISIAKNGVIDPQRTNAKAVATIEQRAQNNIQLTLDGVVDFLNYHQGDDMHTHYQVFKEIFVLCWAGRTKVVKNQTYYTRVDIKLINEQVTLFYSNLDEVAIEWNDDTFTITEYVQLGLQDRFRFFPLERVSIQFRENGSYQLHSQMLFEPPKLDQVSLRHRLNANNALLEKLEHNIPLQPHEKKDLHQLSFSYMLCYLNQIASAKLQLQRARPLLKKQGPAVYDAYKETLRILRKIKYS